MPKLSLIRISLRAYAIGTIDLDTFMFIYNEWKENKNERTN